MTITQELAHRRRCLNALSMASEHLDSFRKDDLDTEQRKRLKHDEEDFHAARALIEAAPRLLAIAERIKELMESGDLPGSYWSEYAQLTAAVDKAKGVK